MDGSAESKLPEHPCNAKFGLLMVSSARDSQRVTADGKSLSMSAMDL